MKQVYLFVPVDTFEPGVYPTSDRIIIKSSRTKAISHCNRELDKPDFTGDKEFTIVSVAGSTVGWITKKMVQ